MIDFAAAREAMVDRQVRTADVTLYPIIEALLARMRCERDQVVPDARIVLPSTHASHEAVRRGISVHPPRWD